MTRPVPHPDCHHLLWVTRADDAQLLCVDADAGAVKMSLDFSGAFPKMHALTRLFVVAGMRAAATPVPPVDAEVSGR